jgi:hypothetical protein
VVGLWRGANGVHAGPGPALAARWMGGAWIAGGVRLEGRAWLWGQASPGLGIQGCGLGVRAALGERMREAGWGKWVLMRRQRGSGWEEAGGKEAPKQPQLCARSHR